MEDLFTNRSPNEAQAEALNAVTIQMQETAEIIEALPPSRFRSLAMTKLEECSMWTKKAVVFTFAVTPEAALEDAVAATAAPSESGDASPEGG